MVRSPHDEAGTWGFFGAQLYPHQVIAALVLLTAVCIVQ
jgi:hypothetical protein